MEQISVNRVFDGELKRFKHSSSTLNCEMTFSIFIPHSVHEEERFPSVYWLSGLTCTDENFVQKAGAFRAASELGQMLVVPDTSPRGEQVADDPQGAYDLGLGAGFYVNATQPPWKDHYQMYDYIVRELPALVEANFPADHRRAISGHSMGGHGALVIALRNPDKYCSASAFSPICHPMESPWGQKAFGAYLGNQEAHWEQYDVSVLMSTATEFVPSLVSIGTADEFYEEQLKPETLVSAAAMSGYPLEFNRVGGYDHSYFFISTFIEQHLKFHQQYFDE